MNWHLSNSTPIDRIELRDVEAANPQQLPLPLPLPRLPLPLPLPLPQAKKNDL